MKLFVALVNRDFHCMECDGAFFSEFILADTKEEVINLLKSEDTKLQDKDIENVIEADFSILKNLRKPRIIDWWFFKHREELTQTKG